MPVPQRVLERGGRREYPLEVLLDGTALGKARPELNERQLLGLTLPRWQRPVSWDEARQVQFIEGVFLGFGCGYYVINGSDWGPGGEAKPMSGWLLDGQQRITAIREFVEGRLTVFGDVTFASLDRAERLRFLREPFPCVELEYQDSEEKLKTLYARLAFGGVPHTAEDMARLR